ncbi:MAG TPA: DUF6178 family protein [Blastocatellia bacterium]|nr:DUF6178 family protein [Blastocatellia bacterium]HMV85828.1 DUF6178 family protein [Blastocatellia bacterium]HMX26865.1 DUF6178 family protein [Blastocatellia bacterium]HMY71397.1 DUF6178 family protein [Blastocatellia bacterium]HMZ19526.1 DUF6178 family protein [Blastocatellia bacterium]
MDQPNDKPVRHAAPNERELLNRILNTPRLERVIPQLQPEVLHRVIQTFGLEDCGELMALVTPAQLARIFDLDLWRTAQPGLDEQFDAKRFGIWLEVLLEFCGAVAAAQKLAGMDAELIVAGLAQHLLVYDRAAITPYQTLDGERVGVNSDDNDRLTSDLDGYVLVARRTDSWDAIIEVLMSLGESHSRYFHQVMQGCRALSNAGFEIDELDDLLTDGDQVLFDLAVSRERRREQQGYVTPAQARAFLQTARRLQLGSEFLPPANPLARAYFRAFEETAADAHRESAPLATSAAESSVAEDTTAAAAVYEVLFDAGVLAQPPHALLGAAEGHASRLGLIQTHMQFVLDRDPTAWALRNEELAYLANTLIAGCSIQTRSFTPQEASEAVVAICNLGLENWPPDWLPANATALSDDFFVAQDLVGVFQVGWTVLHHDVSLYAAEQLIEVLVCRQCDDREIQAGLDTLRIQLAKHWQAGVPWKAREALEVIALLDTPTWAVLLALIDECPVLHAAIKASQGSRLLSVSPSDFEFISENRQIVSVRRFLQSLPETLLR